MSKRAIRSFIMLCLTIGLIFALATAANAADLTPDYYISGSPGAYSVGSSAGGTEIGTGYTTLANALAACSSNWGGPGTPVIQLGSAESPLSVERGDGALISATYTGVVKSEYSAAQTDGLTVAAGVTAELRDFTLTNSVNEINTLAYYAVRVLGGGTLTIGDGTGVIVADGTTASTNYYALNNAGTVTVGGAVVLSITSNTYAIYNTGACTIGTGTTVNANNGLMNMSGTVTISGGTLVSSSTTVTNNGTLNLSGGVVECNGTGRALMNQGTLNMTGGELKHTGTSLYRALDNDGTATISGGEITSVGTTAIWTMYRLTLEGDCQVSASNGTAVDSNTNTKPNSAIIIGGNASITGGSTGVVASAARTGSGGSGPSTLTITGGIISGSSCAVQTSADTEISGGQLSSTGSNSTALSCSGGKTVTIKGGKFTSNGQYSAMGITNYGSTINFSDGSVLTTLTNSSGWGVMGIQNTHSGTVNVSGGSLTARAAVSAPNAKICGLFNNDAIANITGGLILSEGSNNTASAVFDQTSALPNGVFISGKPILKSVSPNTVRLDKRTTDPGALTYFGTSFYANTNAAVAIQGTYDDVAAAYVINGDNYTGAQACALPDAGFGSPRWTSDKATTNILSPASPAALSTLTADGNTSVYLSVKQVFTITVDRGINGTASADVSAAAVDDTVTLSAAPEAGYSFAGWTTASGVTFADGSSPNTTFVMPANAVTVTASWAANQYTVTFSVDGGSGVSPVTQDYNTKISSTPSTTKPGFTFAGWFTDAGLSTAAGFPYTITGDSTLYAKWTANDYTVTYNAENGSVSAASTKVTYGSADALIVPTRTGYTFGGWYDGTGGTGNQVTTVSGVPTGTAAGCVASGKWSLTVGKTLYAKWSINTYTLTFDSNGGSAETDITADYGDSLTLPTPTRADFTFNGWYESETDGNGSGTQFNAAAMPDLGSSGTAKTLYAKWTAKTEIGYTPAPQSYTYGTAGAAYTVSYPSLTGFTVEYYAGGAWTETPPTDAGSYNVRITRGEDDIYAAYASGTQYVITNASQPVTSVTIDYAAETADTTALMEYSADGTDWTDCTANMAIASGWFGDDVYFRLKAKPNYDAGAAQTLSIPARPAAPAAIGMNETSFGQGDGSISGVSTAMAYKAGTGGSWQNAADEELTGLVAGTYYIRVRATGSSFKSLEQELILQNGPKLTVTFDGQGGSTVASAADLSYNASISAPSPAPTRAGYTFDGWYKEEKCRYAWDFGTDKVTANITLYAKWSINTYTLTFDSNGGSAETDITADYRDSLTLPTPIRANFTFNGWYESETDNSGSGTQFNAAAMPDLGSSGTAKTLYAKWTYNPTVTQQPKTITVTETSSSLFSGSEGKISASANMDNAFVNSVEVKVTDTQEDKAGFGFAAGDEVYPFDISLYIKGTDKKTEPAAGYSVTISLPVPASLMDVKELISIMHKSGSGAVTTLASRLELKNGDWYLTFEAAEFSPYALVVRSSGSYDESAGVPYYFDVKGSKVFIGFAANGRYMAPEGASVYVAQNGKSFTDVSGHWAQSAIGFVTERELFLGTSGNAFSPDTGMTRAMFATVVGRLYECSYGEISAPNTHAFTDCDYSAYYGKYVDWAAKNDIIGGYGNELFGPDDPITREQMASVLYRFASFLRVLPNDMDAALNYPDAGSISSYAKNAALYCQTTGVIGGRTGGVFAPQETATRAEVATIIERFVELVVE